MVDLKDKLVKKQGFLEKLFENILGIMKKSYQNLMRISQKKIKLIL